MAERQEGLIKYTLTVVTKAFKSRMQSAQKSVDGMRGKMRKLMGANTRLGKFFASTAKILKSMPAKIALIVAAVAAIGRPLFRGSRAAMDLEQAFAEINSLIDGPGGLTESTKKFIVQMSNMYGRSAVDNAKAYYDIISAGITDQIEANKILEQANKSAMAGVSDVKTATIALTSAINSYGHANLSAAEAGDVLQQIVKSGVTNFPKLAASMGPVNVIAAQLGVSFKELGAMMAHLTAAGIETSQAATMVKGFLKSIIQQGPQAKEALEEVGLQWNLARLQEVGFEQMMSEFAQKLGHRTELIKKVVPEIEGTVGAMRLSVNAGEDLNKKFKVMDNSAGAVDDSMKDLSGTMKQKVSEVVQRNTNAWAEAADEVARYRIMILDLGTALAKLLVKIRPVTSALTKYWEWAMRFMGVTEDAKKEIKNMPDTPKKSVLQQVREGLSGETPPAKPNPAATQAANIITDKIDKIDEKKEEDSKNIKKIAENTELTAKNTEKRVEQEDRKLSILDEGKHRARAGDESQLKKWHKGRWVPVWFRDPDTDYSVTDPAAKTPVAGGGSGGTKKGKVQGLRNGQWTAQTYDDMPTADDIDNLGKGTAGQILLGKGDLNKFFTLLKPELAKLAQKDQIDTLIRELKMFEGKTAANTIDSAQKTDSDIEHLSAHSEGVIADLLLQAQGRPNYEANVPGSRRSPILRR